MGKKLTVKIESNNVLTDFPCVICGRIYDAGPAIAVLSNGKETLGDVCPKCLALGLEGAAAQLKEQAEGLHKEAKRLKRLVSYVEDVQAWPTSEALERATLIGELGFMYPNTPVTFLSEQAGSNLSLEKLRDLVQRGSRARSVGIEEDIPF